MSSKSEQKKVHLAGVAKAEQENIETMHEPKPIQATSNPPLPAVRDSRFVTPLDFALRFFFEITNSDL